MKKGLVLFLSLLLWAPSTQAIVPQDPILPPVPEGHILDEADVLSEEVEQSLDEQLQSLEAFEVEAYVVILADAQFYGAEEWAGFLMQNWFTDEGAGQALILLMAPNEAEGNRILHLELGADLSRYITSIHANQILSDHVLPFSLTGDYDEAVQAGVNEIERLVNGDLKKEGAAESEQGLLWPFLLLLPLVWVVLSWLSNTKGWWLGAFFGGGIGWLALFTWQGALAGAIAGLILDFVVSKFLYPQIRPKRKE